MNDEKTFRFSLVILVQSRDKRGGNFWHAIGSMALAAGRIGGAPCGAAFICDNLLCFVMPHSAFLSCLLKTISLARISARGGGRLKCFYYARITAMRGIANMPVVQAVPNNIIAEHFTFLSSWQDDPQDVEENEKRESADSV